MQHGRGDDWKCVDWDALPPGSTETGTLPTADAARRVREWERKGKNASSLNQ